MTARMTPHAALARLAELDDKRDKLFTTLFEHGSLVVEIYKPEGVDHQKPHSRDEVYVVINGSGMFINGDVHHPFEAGEVLFVPAGQVHRFVDFSANFAAWVFFYGPEGGEAGRQPG
jgi:mannose-6-phosphate isomerase-like protein (cupin superfamily)